MNITSFYSVTCNSSVQEGPPNQKMAIGEEVPTNQEVLSNRENEVSQEETTNNNVSVINVRRIYGNCIMNI